MIVGKTQHMLVMIRAKIEQYISKHIMTSFINVLINMPLNCTDQIQLG